MKVRASLQNIDTLTNLSLRMEPPTAHFRFNAAKVTMQDLIKGVRAAGSPYDARLVVGSTGDMGKLGAALRAVKGVRSPGFPDKNGTWLITFLLDQSTLYTDLEDAASGVGAKLSDSTLKN